VAKAGVKTKSTAAENREAELARYILASSGTMIGICTTLVGLIKIVEGRIGPSRVDEFVALVAIIFLVSAILSYLSIRNNARRLHISRRFGRAADWLFLTGMLTIVGIVALFAIEQI
jgi:uncharacterized membrane protein